jgi:two-component system sensor histidine kinase SenX3
VEGEVGALLAGAVGLLTGACAVAAFWYSDRMQRGRRRRAGTDQAHPTSATPTVNDGLARVLAVLPGAAFVAGADDRVEVATSHAVTLGVVSGDQVVVPEIGVLVAQVRRDGEIREVDVGILRPPLRTSVVQTRVRVAPLSSTSTLVLVEDLSEAARVDAVRRDFVANVSHELKTPVGALALLAEAVESASDEPEAVRHFVDRMYLETKRLANLVDDLIDLSRLQGADEPTVARPVPVARVVGEAVDATRLAAQAGEIDVVVGGIPDVEVLGDEAQLVTALRNLLANAVSYSPARTRVAVSVRVAGPGDVVDISVTDQGIGIPAEEQGRIFERFYRVDPARSRRTGGTGLGLAIVKHVCANHGGECTVWSVPGEGSTFTLRLPALVPAGSRQPPDDGRATAGPTPVAAEGAAPSVRVGTGEAAR